MEKPSLREMEIAAVKKEISSNQEQLGTLISHYSKMMSGLAIGAPAVWLIAAIVCSFIFGWPGPAMSTITVIFWILIEQIIKKQYQKKSQPILDNISNLNRLLPPPPPDEPVYCQNCCAKQEEQNNFCWRCGNRVKPEPIPDPPCRR